MIRILFTAYIVLLVALCSRGQLRNWKEGYYVTIKGDSVSGYLHIDKKDEFKHIKFRQNKEQTDFRLIGIDSLNRVNLDGNQYTMWTGKRSMVAITKFEFQLVNEDSFVVERIPLKLLYKGPVVSLYSFNDIRDHFFYEKDGVISELQIVYSRIPRIDVYTKSSYGNVPIYESFPIYRDQIVAMFGNQKLSRKKQNHIKSSFHERSSMLSLVKALKK